jgi:hypothetical protein
MFRAEKVTKNDLRLIFGAIEFARQGLRERGLEHNGSDGALGERFSYDSSWDFFIGESLSRNTAEARQYIYDLPEVMERIGFHIEQMFLDGTLDTDFPGGRFFLSYEGIFHRGPDGKAQLILKFEIEDGLDCSSTLH